MGYCNRLFAIIFLFIIIFRGVFANQFNKRFEYNGTDTEYQKGVSLEEMDQQRYDHHLNSASTALGIPVNVTLKIPQTLKYYDSPDTDSEVVTEIPAGINVKIMVRGTDSGYWDIFSNLGYGFWGYPTYEKGWRYVKPFLVGEEDKEWEELPYLYIRTEQLEELLGKCYDQNEALQKSVSEGDVCEPFKKRKFIQHNILYIDSRFYQEGIYLSPDFKKPVLDSVSIVLFVLIGIMLGSNIFVRLCKK